MLHHLYSNHCWYGCWQVLPLCNAPPIRLQVKTQRALNDYRKSAFPHYKDEITRLRFIGVVSANRLKDARAHLGQDVPVECVDTVQDLKKLVEYAETNRSESGPMLGPCTVCCGVWGRSLKAREHLRPCRRWLCEPDLPLLAAVVQHTAGD